MNSLTDGDYVVTLQAQPQGCGWSVSRADRVAASGNAPDRESAHRCGAFAVAALSALSRISRRRF